MKRSHKRLPRGAAPHAYRVYFHYHRAHHVTYDEATRTLTIGGFQRRTDGAGCATPP